VAVATKINSSKKLQNKQKPLQIQRFFSIIVVFDDSVATSESWPFHVYEY
jgi:hypothetical protein